MFGKDVVQAVVSAQGPGSTQSLRFILQGVRLRAKPLPFEIKGIKSINPLMPKSHLPTTPTSTTNPSNKVVTLPEDNEITVHVVKDTDSNNEPMNNVEPIINAKSFEDSNFVVQDYPLHCLIALAILNSQTGGLPCSEICNFFENNIKSFKTEVPLDWQDKVKDCLNTKFWFRDVKLRDVLWYIEPTKAKDLNKSILSCFQTNPKAIKRELIVPHLARNLFNSDDINNRDDIANASEKTSDKDPSKIDNLEKNEVTEVDNTRDKDNSDSNRKNESGKEINILDTVSVSVTDESMKNFVKSKPSQQPELEKPAKPKPGYSLSCLCALALINSISGSLTCKQICTFILEHFPYYRTAKKIWKKKLASNLETNSFFRKKDKEWSIKSHTLDTLRTELKKWTRKNSDDIRAALDNPGLLNDLVQGKCKKDYSKFEENKENEIVTIDEENTG